MSILEIKHVDMLEALLKKESSGSMKIFFFFKSGRLKYVCRRRGNLEVEGTKKIKIINLRP